MQPSGFSRTLSCRRVFGHPHPPPFGGGPKTSHHFEPATFSGLRGFGHPSPPRVGVARLPPLGTHPPPWPRGERGPEPGGPVPGPRRPPRAPQQGRLHARLPPINHVKPLSHVVSKCFNHSCPNNGTPPFQQRLSINHLLIYRKKTKDDIFCLKKYAHNHAPYISSDADAIGRLEVCLKEFIFMVPAYPQHLVGIVVCLFLRKLINLCILIRVLQLFIDYSCD